MAIVYKESFLVHECLNINGDKFCSYRVRDLENLTGMILLGIHNDNKNQSISNLEILKKLKLFIERYKESLIIVYIDANL